MWTYKSLPLFVLLVPFLYSQTSTDQLLDIGGRRLFLACSGEEREGVPIVLLLSGMGSDSKTWRAVQPEVATFAKVCTYDRAGLGRSEKAATKQDGRSVIFDLHALLKTAKLNPPYVLVGQSLGGLISRLYATKFPNEVMGMVLVDSTHEGEEARMVKILTEVNGHPPPLEGPRARIPEDLDLQAISIQASQEHWSAYIPLIVLSSDKPRDLPPGLGEKMYAAHQELQGDLAKRSKLSEARVIAGSGHNIQLDKPAEVTSAIRRIVQGANSSK